MTGGLFIVAVVGTLVCFGTAAIIWLTEEWAPRFARNRARRLARRRDVVEMAQYRARRRMVGGGL